MAAAMKIYCPILLYFLASTGTQAQDETLSLTVNVEDAESNVGQIIVSLFDAENYMQTPTAQLIGPVDENGRCVLIFQGLTTGEYAASVNYDEDMDGELDTGLFGIPTENVGFSNSARGRVGPASFKDASFMLAAPGTVININLASAR